MPLLRDGFPNQGLGLVSLPFSRQGPHLGVLLTRQPPPTQSADAMRASLGWLIAPGTWRVTGATCWREGGREPQFPHG